MRFPRFAIAYSCIVIPGLALAFAIRSPYLPNFAFSSLIGIGVLSLLAYFQLLFTGNFINNSETSPDSSIYIGSNSYYGLTSWKPVFTFVILALLAFGYFSGFHLDYPAYIGQWRAYLEGVDPWATINIDLQVGNAYGPLLLLFAYPATIDNGIPKLLFISLFIACSIIACFSKSSESSATKNTSFNDYLFTTFTLSPFSLITVFLFGINDAIPAVLIFASIFALTSFRPSSHSALISGALIGMGFLAKLYPVILVPYLFLSNKTKKFSFIIGISAVLFALLLYIVTTGHNFLSVFLFASNRISTHMSPFYTSRFWGLNIDHLSPFLMVIANIIVIFLVITKKVDSIVASAIALFFSLVLYRVGHQQFYLVFYLLVPYALRLLNSSNPALSYKLASAATPLLLFFNWSQFQYILSKGFHPNLEYIKVLQASQGLFFIAALVITYYIIFSNMPKRAN